MKGLLDVLTVLGSLVFLVLGLRIFGGSIQRWLGGRIKNSLIMPSGNRLTGMERGFLAIVSVQSTSAVTALIMSLVNAGLVNVQSAAAMVLGVNIGASITAWMVTLLGFSLNFTVLALPVMILVLPLSHGRGWRWNLGETLFGLALLLLGISLIKQAFPDSSYSLTVLYRIRRFTAMSLPLTTVLFFFLGAALTAAVQSSSSVLVLVLVVVFRGWLTFPAAAAMVLGCNLGTALVVWRASVPLNNEAARTAWFHILFNLFGVVWALSLFGPLMRLMELAFPETFYKAAAMPIGLAVFYTAFNLLNGLCVFPFLSPLVRLSRFLVRRRDGTAAASHEFALLPAGLPGVVEANLITTRRGLGDMAEKSHVMLMMVLNASQESHPMDGMQEDLDWMHKRRKDLERYLLTSIRQQTSADQAAQILAQQRIAQRLDTIALSCGNIAVLIERLRKKGYRIHREGNEELYEFMAQVLDFLRYDGDFINRKFFRYDRTLADSMEAAIDRGRDRLRKRARKSLEKDHTIDVRGELLFIDIVRHLEQIGDFCLDIAASMGDLS